MNSIEVHNLTKKFEKFTSVNNISFEVGEGEVFGFLGSNGAGKSTTIKMLCGILSPTSGDANVGGFSIRDNPDMVKRNIGYMSQKFSLYNDLTVAENINFFGGVYGLKDQKLRERKKWVLEISELHDKENTPASSLAVGYKQRLALGCAVIHEPKIVFLDEPTGGVDPISRRRFWDLINELSEKGTTVFVTTHCLDEAEFCNRIILIDEGRLIANGSPDELKKKYITNPVIELNTDDIYKTLEILEQEYYPGNISIFGNALHITLNESHSTDTENEIKIISDTIKNHSTVRINSIQRIEPSLEDVFMNLLEKKASDVK